jgi:RimJ/RimL family protein N-acetyltransferase
LYCIVFFSTGGVLAGRPEARFEAYARGYAGCGDHTNLSYRRSYARLYEALCCKSHQTDDQYTELYDKSPEVIVGSCVRLEALDAPKHLAKLFDATNGEIYYEHKSYEPQEVWGFLEDGPFESAQDLLDSFVFRHLSNEAAFCIINNITNRIIGVILLRNDDPKNLSIQIDPPIVPPSYFGSKEQLEACFLLMDRLYAHGYRRIQYSIDAKDSQTAKLADRLGFTMEGTLLKHMVIKDSSRDSTVYGMLNSDWEKGARVVLYRKLYGMAAARGDVTNNQKEEELDEQNQFLAEEKAKKAELAKEMGEKDKKH